MTEADPKKDLIKWIMLTIVLVIVVIGVALAFYFYIYPVVKEWGWEKPPAVAPETGNILEIRQALNYYADLPGGYVFFSICQQEKIDVCDIELMYQDEWRIRPFVSVADAKVDYILPFRSVEDSQLTDFTQKSRAPLDFYRKWTVYERTYKSLVENLRGKSYEEGIKEILKFGNAMPSDLVKLEIGRRYGGANEFQEFDRQAAELNLRAIVLKEDMGRQDIAGKIIEFTKDYVDFSRFSDKLDDSVKEAQNAKRISLLFIPEIGRASISDNKKKYIFNQKKASDAIVWGVLIYDNVDITNKAWVNNLGEKEVKRNWRRFIFIKGDLPSGMFNGPSDPTPEGMSQQLGNWYGTITVAVKGNVGDDFGKNSYLLNALIIGKADANLGSYMRSGKIVVKGNTGSHLGIGMRTGYILVTGEAKYQIGYGAQASTIEFSDFSDESMLAKRDVNGGNEAGNINIPMTTEVFMKGKRVWPKDVPWENPDWTSLPIVLDMENDAFVDGAVELAFYKGKWVSRRFKLANDNQWCDLSLNREGATKQKDLGAKEIEFLKNFPKDANFNEGIDLIFNYFVNNKGNVIWAYHWLEGKEYREFTYSAIAKEEKDKGSLAKESLIQQYKTLVYGYNINQKVKHANVLGIACAVS